MVGLAPELPNILGTKVPVSNNTDLRTQGWELTIGWRDALQNGLNYAVNFNLSDARTKITRYPNNPTNSVNSYIAGQYIGEIWGYTTKGLARTDQEMLPCPMEDKVLLDQTGVQGISCMLILIMTVKSLQKMKL